MKKIILLTGGGYLPDEVIKKLRKSKKTFFCLGFENNPVSKIILKSEHKVINFGSIITELKNLRLKGYCHILLIGNLKRPGISEIKPDFNSLKLIPHFTKVLLQGGDNNILNFSINFLKKLGFKIIDLRKLIPESFLGFGDQTRLKVPKKCLIDIEKGKRILNKMSIFDIGQSLIIQQGNVIGIETSSGTDNLIKYSSPLFKDGMMPILIKLSKVNQNLKADLPTIGPLTVKNCFKKSINGIVYSANKTLFINKKKIIDYCNQKNIFLYGI